MSKSNCKSIRRQLEEMTLGDECTAEVLEHLHFCNECRDFHHKQTNLRQIVGSLGTVNAPADFDFRLRSRLASEKENTGFHFGRGFWYLGQRSAAVATLLVLVVGAAFTVRYFATRPTRTVASAGMNDPVKVQPTSSPVKSNSTPEQHQTVATTTSPGSQNSISKRDASVATRVKRPTVAADFSSERAPLVRNSGQSTEQVFPIDASQQSLRVSLFDGRGNPRTLSLPTVTFGSQRVVPTSTSFAQKGVW